VKLARAAVVAAAASLIGVQGSQAATGLSVVSLQADKKASARGILPVTATVTNPGRSASSPAKLAFLLSKDKRLGKDLRLASGGVPKLDPGRLATVARDAKLPARAKPGRWNVLACVGKACKAKAVLVTPPRPNVRANVVSTPASVELGKGLNVPLKARNLGGARSKAAKIRLYLSLDEKRSAGDVALPGTTKAPKLAARASRKLTAKKTVPTSAAAAAYHVLACTGKAPATCTASAGVLAAVLPAQVDAPPNPVGAPTSVADSTSFLWQGSSAPQRGVDPAAMKALQACVLRGRVLDSAGKAIPAVRVSVLDQPKLGYTTTRADGRFDVVVNGGGQITLAFLRAGYLPLQRRVEAPADDFLVLEDTVLLPADSAVSWVEAGADRWQVHRGSQVEDADGKRRATILFQPGFHATITPPGGSAVQLPALSMRATEYTRGPSGEQAMPGDLPPQSGYTYAVAYTADEELDAGADQVDLDKPAFAYTENFVGFKIGAEVPSGTYEDDEGQWSALDNGRVLQILSVSGGIAAIDADGDGTADSDAALNALGITKGERETLATIYPAGAPLWRVPLKHFSSKDYNWPYGPPDDAVAPNGGTPSNGDPGCPVCGAAGSRLGIERQTLGEDVAVGGTPYRLTYDSSRVLGHVASRTIRLPLTGATVPASLGEISLRIAVAGRSFANDYEAKPNILEYFTWDGKDAYGRTVQGWVNATVTVGFTYNGRYYGSRADQQRAFGQFSGYEITPGPKGPGERRPSASGTVNMRLPITIWRQWTVPVGTLDARGTGIGGWDLDVHHVYDPSQRVLYLGTGERLDADAQPLNKISLAAGWNGSGLSGGDAGEGVPAVGGKLAVPWGATVAPDGTVYFSDILNGKVRKITPEGLLYTVFTRAGGRITDVDLGPDGRLYMVDQYHYQILALDLSTGNYTIIAGTGQQGSTGDGGPATQATLEGLHHLAVGPDGTVYFVNIRNGDLVTTVRAIAPDGTIQRVVGGGPAPPSGNPYGNGLPATQVRLSSVANAVAVGPDGSLYVVDYPAVPIVRHIGLDGRSELVAGGYGSSGDGGSAVGASLYQISSLTVSRDGILYIGELGRVRAVDQNGIISTIAGDGTGGGYAGDNGLAAAAKMGHPTGLAVAPDGTIYVTDGENNRVRAVRPSLPGAALTDIALPAPSGDELYLFNRNGRHLSTFDTLTGARLALFGYDAAGRLQSVTDVDGRVTTVERDSAGLPQAIVAPGGRRTTLGTNGDGYVTGIHEGTGGTTTIAYADAGGLITTWTDPDGRATTFTYDTLGQLTQEHDPNGGSQTLTRTDLADGLEVKRELTSGATTTFRWEQLPDGSVRRRVTSPAGALTESVLASNGVETTTFPDGRVLKRTLAADPRFGPQVAYAAKEQILEPSSGPSRLVTRTRAVDLGSSADPLSIVTLSETAVRDGQTWTGLYTGATRTFVETSPAGRTRQWTLDAKGRVTAFRPAASLDVLGYSYDTRGRLTQEGTSGLHVDYAYDGLDRLITQTDGAGGAAHFAYDGGSRMNQLTTPNGEVYGLTRDAAGDLTGVTTPRSGQQALAWDGLGNLRSFTAPGGSALQLGFDTDRRPTGRTLPGGRQITASYAQDRPSGLSFPEGTVAIGYGDTTARPASATRTAAGGGPVERIDYEHGGDLVKRDLVSGTASGDFRYTWGTGIVLASWSLDGSSSTVGRDADLRVTADGPWAISRDGAGLATAESAGNGRIASQYDGLGRLTQRIVTAGSSNTEVYRVDVTYDAAGRASSVAESGGGGGSRTFGYDADGQLTSVTGAETGTYAYDTNGNRTTGGATYDLQDRQLTLGAAAYGTDADGFVTARGSDTFTYSARGELLSATVGGTTVTYRYDSLGRRVARTQGGSTEQYLYGDLDDAYLVTASKAGGVTTVYRYDDEGRLVALERSGTRYVVGSDQVGSPRVIADATTGAIVRTIRYDAWGVVVASSGSFALPLGFAGGLADDVTGLIRFGYRDYEPATGRFTARDPLLHGGEQMNLYAYVGSNPVSARDESGLKVKVCYHGSLITGFKPFKPLNHWWIETGSKKLGIGPGGPLGVEDVQWTDQSYKYKLYNKDEIRCEDQNDVDEGCVNRAIFEGKSEGQYVPGANDCQTNVNAVLDTCRTSPIKPP
jgi:RHS repeat-associated protein